MADMEKLTINMGIVDLGQVDLLVAEGFYTSRTDFLRSAIRAQLGAHAEVIGQAAKRRMLAIGTVGYQCEDLEHLRTAGERLDIRVLGLLHLGADIAPELAQATIASIRLFGVFRASRAVKAALADVML